MRLCFDVHLPTWLPRAWRFDGFEHVPGTTTMVRLRFRGPRGRWFLLTQRVGTVDLRTEAEIVSNPFTASFERGVEILSFAGARVAGEPIDGWHWHRTRQVVAWQSGDVICELEQVRGRGLRHGQWRRVVRSAVDATAPRDRSIEGTRTR